MRKLMLIALLITLLTSCSFIKQFQYDNCGEVSINDNDFSYGDRDSLVTVIKYQQLEIDSLSKMIASQDSLIERMRLELDEAGQMVAIHTGFMIPDTITFAGVLFDLKNERIADKFEKIYNQEVKDAHKYIPRSGRYFSYFDSVFAHYGVPTDAKYLAVAESRLSYLAQSPVGAMGIWQFMKSTATGFNMKVNDYVDQRRDIYLATDAAARFLLSNYSYLEKRGVNDWLLAFCGYNAGIGNVMKVIKAQGGKKFFDLIMGVDETNRYVWKAVALKLIFENEEKIFNQKFTRHIPIDEEVKRVKVKLKGYYEIDDWSQAQGTYVSRVWELNPWIKTYQRSRKKYSPVIKVVMPPGEYTVCLPKDAVPDNDEIARIEKKFLDANDGYFTEYVVKRGDSLYKISRKYKTSISKLKSINGLRSDVIYPGQKLRLFGYSQPAASKSYTVKSGDSVSNIAYKLGVSVNHILKSNNLKKDNKGNCLIYPGQKLVY